MIQTPSSRKCQENIRPLDHQILGIEIPPHSQCKKYVFFPIPDEKFPIWQSLYGPNKLQMYQLKNSIKIDGNIKKCADY